jgi:hypothetical protein
VLRGAITDKRKGRKSLGAGKIQLGGCGSREVTVAVAAEIVAPLERAGAVRVTAVAAAVARRVVARRVVARQVVARQVVARQVVGERAANG